MHNAPTITPRHLPSPTGAELRRIVADEPAAQQCRYCAFRIGQSRHSTGSHRR